MTDDMKSRRRNAAAAFIARRGELGLSQDEVANRAGVVVRTVLNFEHGRWPNPATRSKLEKAVDWPSGEIQRLASPPRAYIPPQLLDLARELSDDQREWYIRWLEDLPGEVQGRRTGG